MTSQLHLYRLRFITPLHIGNERADYASGSATVHSDTFYAALFFAAARLGLDALLPKDQYLRFSISSLFPFVQHEAGTIYFFPRPQFFAADKQERIEDGTLRKKLKKVSFVDQRLFEMLLTGTSTVSYLKAQNLNNEYWSVSAIADHKFIDSHVVPRVSVPRATGGDTKIFYIERHYFSPDAGLFFLVSFADTETKKLFDATLRFLGEEGVGTDRNLGHGKFEVAASEPFKFNIAPVRQLAVNLGLYCPTDKQELHEALAGTDVGYDIIKRGGWLSEPYNSWRKRNVYMFKAGSCFSNRQQDVITTVGKLVDLRPLEVHPAVQHPIWRSGRTLFLSF